MPLSCEPWRTLRSTQAGRDSDSHTDSDAAIFPNSCFLIQPFLCQPCARAQQIGDGCGCLNVSQQSSSHGTSKWCTLCTTTRPIISYSKRPSPVASPATPKDRASPGTAPDYPCLRGNRTHVYGMIGEAACDGIVSVLYGRAPCGLRAKCSGCTGARSENTSSALTYTFSVAK